MVSVGVVHSSRDIKDKVTEEKRYYISSLPANAETMARAARDHWDIENGLHWVLDVTFNEDGSRIRNDNAPEIISIIKKWAMNILNQHKDKISMRRMARRISMSPKMLLTRIMD